jgi:hypothetical protein
MPPKYSKPPKHTKIDYDEEEEIKDTLIDPDLVENEVRSEIQTAIKNKLLRTSSPGIDSVDQRYENP